MFLNFSREVAWSFLTDRFLVAAPMMGDSKSRNLSKLGSLVPIWERGHHTKFQLPSPLIGRARRGQSFDPFWTPPNYVLALAENFSWQIFFSLGGFQGPLRVSGWQKKIWIFINKIWRKRHFLPFSLVSLRGCRKNCSGQNFFKSSQFIVLE